MSACGFCKGGPVGNAASWLDDKPRPPAACPRCGEVNWPEIPLDDAIQAARSVATTEDRVEREYFRAVLLAYLDQRMSAALERAFDAPSAPDGPPMPTSHGERNR